MAKMTGVYHKGTSVLRGNMLRNHVIALYARSPEGNRRLTEAKYILHADAERTTFRVLNQHPNLYKAVTRD